MALVADDDDDDVDLVFGAVCDDKRENHKLRGIFIYVKWTPDMCRSHSKLYAYAIVVIIEMWFVYNYFN